MSKSDPLAKRSLREPKSTFIAGTRYSKEDKIRKAQTPPPPMPGGKEPPHPERPPPNVPIPGEPTVEGGTDLFICEICGKVFNSKDELQLHLQTDHAPQKKGK